MEEICDLMSRESECCGSVERRRRSFTKHYQSFVRCKWRDVFVYGEENGCVLFSAIKMRRSVREEEYYRNALMDAMEQIDEDGWED